MHTLFGIRLTSMLHGWSWYTETEGRPCTTLVKSGMSEVEKQSLTVMLVTQTDQSLNFYNRYASFALNNMQQETCYCA